MEEIYDVAVIGGGPAGVAAAIYTSRKQLKTIFLTDTIGGQSVGSSGIENWIGVESLSGIELAKALEKHLRAQENINIQTSQRVSKLESTQNGVTIETEKGDTIKAQTAIITTGGRHRHLGVPGEEEFSGKGVVFCATCDAPFFRDKTVAVVGGGNSGLEAVVDLFPFAKKIYLIVLGDTLKGDPITQEEVKASEKVEIIYGANTTKILGEKMVTGLEYEEIPSDEKIKKTLDVDGVFVQIGSVPNTEFAKNLVETNDFGEIVINHKSGETSQPGVFAAGDATDTPYKQNNIAAGDAVKAALSAYDYVLKKRREQK
ncbi:MAG: FAD-dependent oxidoreductase [Candidatus Moranbacteria bacterium]|nr:FAD-dependent oxidoreductase [Candidatus Moranbacteria bacterium]